MAWFLNVNYWYGYNLSKEWKVGNDDMVDFRISPKNGVFI